MKKIPEKIQKKDNQESQTYLENKHGMYLFNFLKALDAFQVGANNSTDMRIAEFMYEPAASADRGDRDTTKDVAHYELATYGLNRIKHLKRRNPKNPFTKLEAEFLHRIFTNATSEDWGEAVTPKELVTVNINSIISRLTADGLPWPMHLPAYYQFKSILEVHAGRTPFSVGYSEPETKSVSPASRDKNFPEPLDQVTTYEPGTVVQIHLGGISSRHNQVIVFYTCDQNFESVETGKLEIYDVRLLRHVHIIEGTQRLNHPSGDMYQINPNPGKYCLSAIGVPANWDLESELGFNLNEDAVLSENQSQSLIYTLKQKLMEQPEDIQIASHHYRI